LHAEPFDGVDDGQAGAEPPDPPLEPPLDPPLPEPPGPTFHVDDWFEHPIATAASRGEETSTARKP
jgi:hypothetical protein